MLTYIHHIPDWEVDREPAPKLGERPYVHPKAKIIRCRLGSWTEIGAYSSIFESTIDDYSYVAASGSSITYSTVGKFTSIASRVCINPVNHPMGRPSQHHCTYRRVQYRFSDSDDEEIFQWRKSNGVKIGSDVWVGHGAIIMPGVKVESGAVIGAGSVVTKNVDPYLIVAGVPATPIRKRFSQKTIDKLLAIQWWNWDRKSLEQFFADLCGDIESFVEKHGK